MRLLTISASDTCYKCKGTGIAANVEVIGGIRRAELTVCNCVSARVVKPKAFAQEVAKHLEDK